ncbi:YnfU family zinc-binding protein [Kosakonia radicincitans]
MRCTIPGARTTLCLRNATGYFSFKEIPVHSAGLWYLPAGKSLRAICIGIVYGYSPFIRKYSMPQRKDSKNNRNFLTKCTCPHCAMQSEHSFTRVQKGSALMCPHCSKIFKQDKPAYA